MAGQITHIIAGEAALEWASPESCAAILRKQGPAFRLGCQGPDIFYHNQRTKPSGLHYGALAHRRDYGRIVEGAALALPAGRLRPETPAGAYLLGLATHAAVDRSTHPFIVFYSSWADPSRPGTERYRSCHPFFERILDIGLLAKRRGLEPWEFDMEALMAPLAPPLAPQAEEGGGSEQRRVDEELVALWASGLRHAFPRSAGGDFLLERRVANALEDARHFMRITNPARTAMRPDQEDWFAYLDDRVGPRSIALVYPDRLPPGIDLEKLGSEGWDHPSGDGRRSTATYFELVDAAIVEIGPILRRVLSALESEEWDAGLAEAIGNGGLSINDLEGKPLAPRLSRPLPLPEFMAEEYAARLEWARRAARGASRH